MRTFHRRRWIKARADLCFFKFPVAVGRRTPVERERSKVQDSLKQKELEIATLKASVERKDEEARLALLEKEKEDSRVVAGKDAEIAALKAEIARKDGDVKAQLAERTVQEQALAASKDAEIRGAK